MIQVGGPYTPETLNEGKVNLGNPNNPVNATYSGGGSGTVSDGIWTRNSGKIYPFTITDRVSLGTTSYVGSERLRVLGETNTDTLRTANAYIDTARIRSGNNYANLTATLTTTRNILFPDASGTLALTSDIPLFANAALLATYTNTNAAITNTINYAHQHSNYSTLNSITPTYFSNWNTAYGWGNHAGLYASISHNHTGTYQPLDADLTSIAGLSGTSGLLRKTGADTWTLDTATYLTSYTETDPIFTASAAYGIDNTDITNWDSAYTNSHTHTNKTLLDGLISSGSGLNFLSDDGTYKLLSVTVAGNDTEVQYNAAGGFGADPDFTYNATSNTISVGSVSLTNTLYLGGITTYVNDVAGDLTFTDTNAGSVTLATLVAGATNFWTGITGGIYYGAGSDKVGINTNLPNESLTVIGNIEATQFNSKYYRYNGNWLIGTNVGTSLLRTNVIAFDNTDTATPLTLMDLTSRQIEFDGNVLLSSGKNLTLDGTVTTQYLQFNTSPADPSIHTEGLLYWNSSLGALNMMSDISGCIAQIPYENWVKAYNNTGATITSGSAVYVTSAAGDVVYVALARANSESTSLVTIGLATHDIPDGTSGNVTISGTVHNINTSTLTEGGYVYVSPSVAGGLTSTRPVAPNTVAAIGICTVRDASVGSVFVNLRVQPTVERLSNVYISGISDQEVLSWDAANNRWKNRPVTATPPSDGIFDWDVANNRYQPYSTQQASLSFDSSSTFPVLNTRLNLNGDLYTTRIHSKDVRLEGIAGVSVLTLGDVSGINTLTLPTTTGTLALTSDIITPTDDILDWSTNKYTPFTSKQSGINLYTGTTDPDGTTRLNLNADLHVPTLRVVDKLDVGGLIDPTGLQLTPVATNPGDANTIWSNSGDSNALYYGATPVGGSSSPTDNIFDWDGVNSWYAPYSTKQASMSFYTGTTDPTLTTRLNLDAELHTTILYTNSPSNLSSYFKSATATVTEMRQEGSSATANNLFKINRLISGTGNVTGNIIDITDNPTTSGTISGKVLSAIINSTERISLNPRAASTGNAVAYLFDTHNSLAVGDKIFSIRNIGSEKLSIDYAGLLNTNSYLAGVAGTGTNITSNSLYINTSYTNRLRLDPFVTDAANAIAYLFDTNNNLITNGAKTFSIRNQGIEKASIDKDGAITSSSLAGTGDRTLGVDSTGKLKVIAASNTVIYSASVTLTASQVFNNTWVQIVASPGTGKMIISDKCYLFYNYGTSTYTANELTIELSYDAGTSTHATYVTDNAANLLNSTSDKVGLVFSHGLELIPSSNALYIRNNTSMSPPSGDGTLTLTIWYSIIDI